MLQATVTENRSGRVLLTVGNRQISADTSLPLVKGQQLTLQVHSLGERPVLKLSASTLESPLSSAIRLLLPKQAPMTPLMATLSQLTRSPEPPLPPFISELVRSVVKQMPDTETVADHRALKRAIAESGIFLERRLLQQLHKPVGSLGSNSDFKANLLRLIQLLRHWPGSPGRATTASAPNATTAAGPAADRPSSTTATVTGSEQRTPSAQTTPPASSSQIQRSIQATLSGRTTVSAPSPPASAQVSPGTATGSTTAGSAAGAYPPPLRGSIPTPHSMGRSTLELSTSIANLRTDLLQQADAALARLQLHQLAALPREGERGLLEWLFELPVRRGEDIDLWPLRVVAEQREKQQARHQARRWSVQLAFDLPGLGPMQAQVQLEGEQVSAHFWAEDQATLPLLRDNMHKLRAALGEVGLDVRELECQAGPRPPLRSAGGQPLIREKA